MPAISNMDPPLTKTKFIRYGGSTSALAYCRRKSNYHADLISAREEQAERNSLTDTKVTREGGRGGVPGTRADVPLQPLVQPMEAHRNAEIHLQSMKETHWRRRCPKKGCDPMGSLCWNRVLAGTCRPCREKSPCWNRFPVVEEGERAALVGIQPVSTHHNHRVIEYKKASIPSSFFSGR
ncbi:hypothetical protein DUI87_18968 [Hirundo rustica rustica]|uniref:Uncharacterized protein n=1 Tax=Hirundo rustica rustica TaxID=333673 RepID=A0A3M0JU50_HIRRU|nr:hypothetical protein DUI87_18968 [Hirundo rustica rustica]